MNILAIANPSTLPMLHPHHARFKVRDRRSSLLICLLYTSNLIEMGVGAIKVDFGEGAPLDAIYANGRRGLYEHNQMCIRDSY